MLLMRLMIFLKGFRFVDDVGVGGVGDVGDEENDRDCC